MDVLESVLAFALVMILFSTIVSGISELAMRVVRVRAKNLCDAVTALVDDLKLKSTGSKEDLVEALLRNPSSTFDKEGGFFRTFFGIGENKIDTLSAKAFVQRFAGTAAGKRFYERVEQNGGEKGDALVVSLINTFERYMAASSEVFRKRAQRVAFVSAIVLAFAINIDATRLFSHVYQDREQRAELVAKLSDALSEDAQTTNDATQPGNAGNTGSVEAHAKAIAAISKEIDTIQDVYNLPVGYDYAPWGEKGDTGLNDTAAVVLWFVKIFFTGVLIGLGGPFWFRIYANLSQLVQVLKAFGGKSPETVADLRPQKETPGAGRSSVDEITELVKLFKETAVFRHNTSPSS